MRKLSELTVPELIVLRENIIQAATTGIGIGAVKVNTKEMKKVAKINAVLKQRIGEIDFDS